MHLDERLVDNPWWIPQLAHHNQSLPSILVTHNQTPRAPSPLYTQVQNQSINTWFLSMMKDRFHWPYSGTHILYAKCNDTPTCFQKHRRTCNMQRKRISYSKWLDRGVQISPLFKDLQLLYPNLSIPSKSEKRRLSATQLPSTETREKDLGWTFSNVTKRKAGHTTLLLPLIKRSLTPPPQLGCRRANNKVQESNPNSNNNAFQQQKTINSSGS